MIIIVDLKDDLLVEIKNFAVQNQVTVRAVIENALHNFLQQQAANRISFKIHRATFSGNGLQSEIQEGNWNQIRSHIYEDQGG